MKTFEAGIRIGASAEQVWQVLVDVGSYRDWSSGVDRVDGTVGLGERLVVHATVARGRAFPVTVTEIRPGEAMRWQGGLPLGLFVGERTFRLDPQADGSTEFTMREEYSGPLTGLLGRTIPDLNPSFRAFAAGLKARAEQRAAQLSG
ncbi:MAG: Polyketide cyclase/dehydrase [Modestobacter sp.]|nr:Polyketide cyclase/dehydrase [Modestobacter sp.]